MTLNHTKLTFNQPVPSSGQPLTALNNPKLTKNRTRTKPKPTINQVYALYSNAS